jgi:hypothetical protein
VLDVGVCCDACTEGNIAWVFAVRIQIGTCALKLVGAWCVLRVTSDACTGGATGNSPTCTGGGRWIRVGSTELNWFVLVCVDALYYVYGWGNSHTLTTEIMNGCFRVITTGDCAELNGCV